MAPAEVPPFAPAQRPMAPLTPPGLHPAPDVAMRPGPPAGKPRSFGISLLLVIVTLGIYGLVWAYKVFAEVDREQGIEHDQIWFWLGFIPSIGLVFTIIYYVTEIGKLNRARLSRGMDTGVTPGLFWLLFFLGFITLFITTIIGYYKLQQTLNGYWRDVYSRKAVPFPLQG